jgi:hypothetical protein
MSFTAKALGFVGAYGLPTLCNVYIDANRVDMILSTSSMILPAIAATSSQEFYEDAKTGYEVGSYLWGSWNLGNAILFYFLEVEGLPQIAAARSLMSLAGSQLMPVACDQVYEYFNPLELVGEQNTYIID